MLAAIFLNLKPEATHACEREREARIHFEFSIWCEATEFSHLWLTTTRNSMNCIFFGSGENAPEYYSPLSHSVDAAIVLLNQKMKFVIRNWISRRPLCLFHFLSWGAFGVVLGSTAEIDTVMKVIAMHSNAEYVHQNNNKYSCSSSDNSNSTLCICNVKDYNRNELSHNYVFAFWTLKRKTCERNLQ